jgi:hypothetical protein
MRTGKSGVMGVTNILLPGSSTRFSKRFGTLQAAGPLNERRNHPSMNHLKLYDLERYLFEDVRNNFHQHGQLSAFDFFCIIIWKSNRAKTKIAQRLLKNGHDVKDLEAQVRKLTTTLFKTSQPKERLRILMVDWGFRLPMASAILAVLYPDDFSVYDVRVCDELKNHHKLQFKTNFEGIWEGYKTFLRDVSNTCPKSQSLRDKDRSLWAKSFERQLRRDLENGFKDVTP